MQKNSLMKRDDSILRVLECHDDEVLVIDCKKAVINNGQKGSIN